MTGNYLLYHLPFFSDQTKIFVNKIWVFALNCYNLMVFITGKKTEWNSLKKQVMIISIKFICLIVTVYMCSILMNF